MFVWNTITQMILSMNYPGRSVKEKTLSAWRGQFWLVSCTIHIRTRQLSMFMCFSQSFGVQQSMRERKMHAEKLTQRIDFCMNAEDWFVCLSLKWLCVKCFGKSISNPYQRPRYSRLNCALCVVRCLRCVCVCVGTELPLVSLATCPD